MTDRKSKTTQLAKDTFLALAPWVNIYCPGVENNNVPPWEEPEPVYTITQECAQLHARHKAGGTGLTYSDGTPYQPRDYGRGILNAADVQATIDNRRKHYYSGGRDGRTICSLDLDAHCAFQTDQKHALDLLTGFLGAANVYHQLSGRGEQLILKINYGSERWNKVNRALLDLGDALQIRLKAQEIYCDLEVKGLISTFLPRTEEGKYGTLAKLPCYTPPNRPQEAWTEGRLAQFTAMPVHTLGWIRGAMEALRERTDSGKAHEWQDHCLRLREAEELAALPSRLASLRKWQRFYPDHEGLAKEIAKAERRLGTVTVSVPAVTEAVPVAIPEAVPVTVSVPAPKPRKVKAVRASGSATGLPLTDDEIERIPDLVKAQRQHAYYLCAMRPDGDSVRVTALDFQYALVVMSICARAPNKDDQNPQERSKAIWQALYNRRLPDRTVFTRQFCDKRWKRIRDTMVDAGFIDVIDSRYWFYADGSGRKGKAMQWRLRAEFVVEFGGWNSPRKVDRGLTVIGTVHTPPG